MKDVFKREIKLSKGWKIAIGVMAVVVVAASSVMLSKISHRIQKVVVQDAEGNVANISQLNATLISRELISRQVLLESIAINLATGKDYKTELLLEKMKTYTENSQFYNMGVLSMDGILHTTMGKVIDVSEKSPYKEALNGQPVISESFLPDDGTGELLNIMTMPVVYKGTTKFILTGTYRSTDLAELLNVSAFEGRGFTFLLDADGNIVVEPACENEEYAGLLEFVRTSETIAPGFMEKRDITFSTNGISYCAHFEPLEVNDWYLMTCAMETDVYASVYRILQNVFIGMGFLWTEVLISISVLLFSWVRHQNQIKQTIFKDQLLKTKNFEYLRIIYPQFSEEERGKMALLALDVDKFKEYNFIYGAASGDKLLAYINRMFCEELPGDRLYRYTGDQFVGLILCQDRDEAERKVSRLIARAARDIEKKRIKPFEMSVGLCMLKDYDQLQMVYSDALIAKNTIKGNHAQKYAFFDETMRQERLEYMEMESSFQDAVRNREFQVYYQPKFDMRTKQIVGAEALVRWKKADGQLIPPGAFIPCFEASRQIVVLDEVMLENVCRQMKAMEQEGLPVFPVSVNLSRVHVKYPGITDKIESLLKETKITPSNLILEITESALYEEQNSLNEIVEKLHELGCRVSMDDYGMGVSSPSSLANISFDVLKLDKSFISQIGNKKMEFVIRSTIRLASDLGMGLIAEGVETGEQAESLKQWGCYYAQGYYYSRPVPEQEYCRMLRQMKE